MSRSPKFGEMLRQLEPKRDRNSVAIFIALRLVDGEGGNLSRLCVKMICELS